MFKFIDLFTDITYSLNTMQYHANAAHRPSYFIQFRRYVICEYPLLSLLTATRNLSVLSLTASAIMAAIAEQSRTTFLWLLLIC